MAVAQPGGDRARRIGRRPRDPLHVGHAAGVSQHALAVIHDQRVGGGADLFDVHLASHCDPEAVALADRVVDDAAVPAEHAAGGVHDRPGFGAGAVEEDRDVVPLEEILALGLSGQIAQPGLVRERAHPMLGLVAEREEDLGQLRLREAREEVGLVLGRVRAAQQAETSNGFVAHDARVMAGREAVEADAERAGAGRQQPELHDGVAEGAGVRGQPRQVLAAERVQHPAVVLVGQRHGVVGNAEAFGGRARRRDVVGLARPVTGVALGRGEGLLGVPNTHRQPDDSIPLPLEQPGRDAGVHPAAHAHRHGEARRPFMLRVAHGLLLLVMTPAYRVRAIQVETDSRLSGKGVASPSHAPIATPSA